MVILLIIVTGRSPTSSADESLPQPVEDGSTYSSIRDPCRILRYIPLRPHYHRLAAYHLSRREMAARDPHIPCPRRRDDDHVTGCCYRPRPSALFKCRRCRCRLLHDLNVGVPIAGIKLYFWNYFESHIHFILFFLIRCISVQNSWKCH